MTYDLSYPGQRCIIEFLEANKRIHLVSRSPALQNAEKSIPCNLDYVQIASDALTLNNISMVIIPATEQIPEDDPRYASRPDEVETQPGFIRSGHSASVWHRRFKEVVFFRNGEQIASRPLAENVKDYIALEKLNRIMLGGRKDIRVNMLEFNVFYSRANLRLLEGLNFRIRGLNTNKEDFKYYLPLIDVSSFPLKKLKIPFLGSQIFEHPIVQLAGCLTIDEFTLFNESIPLNDINKLTNKTVVIQHSRMRKEDIITLIRNWLSGEKSIGTTLIMEKTFVMTHQEILRSIKETYEEFEDDLKNVEENFLPNCPRFCIPINNSSNLLVYGVDKGIVNHFNCPISAFVMKVVATTPEVMPGNCRNGVSLVLPFMIFVGCLLILLVAYSYCWLLTHIVGCLLILLVAYSYFCAPSTEF
ncbi:hypothetical protein GCK72_007706 [Caenorhabditis remanei]|uniref:Uncharacterized protein n=1 Tax=Caenorhabditis remanei TaxID=31234 RepID=A0A6A5HN30_CAERE|nr:hypothetical protein GCK72_007706 [Caenorhabditis remanei]KAF1767747.1 hypothetical protein GCK72_007706 [Caenorhabditis remanei]